MSAALIYLGLVLVAQAAPLSVSELLSNPDRFNGQPVTVTGTISNFRGNPLRRRSPLYTFDLSGGPETVHVRAFAKPACQSGAATVEGTFGQIKWRVNASYSFEEITAHNVICLPDRGPKTK
jgi:hypothetical protein